MDAALGMLGRSGNAESACALSDGESATEMAEVLTVLTGSPGGGGTLPALTKTLITDAATDRGGRGGDSEGRGATYSSPLAWLGCCEGMGAK